MRADSPETWRVIEECAQYIGKADADILSMYVNHALEVELEDGVPVSLYAEYVDDMIGNYEQIWRESSRAHDRESCELMLVALRREAERFPRPEEAPDEYERGPFCNACGTHHAEGDCDLDPANEPVHVTVDLYISGARDPDAWVRQHLNFRDERGVIVQVADVFRDDPES